MRHGTRCGHCHPSGDSTGGFSGTEGEMLHIPCGGGGNRPMSPSHASVVHTFEAVAGSWGSASAQAVNRVMGGVTEGKKEQQYVKWHLGKGFY